MNKLAWRDRIAGTVLLAGLLTPLTGTLYTTFAIAQSQQPDLAQKAPAAQAPYAMSYAAHLTVRADATATEISTLRYKILAPASIQPLSQQSLSFVEGMETLETIEAFTEKADGRRVPVEPASIITRDGGSGSVATYTRDRKERIIIFPNVEVGDTLVMTNKQEIQRGLFPGQFFYVDTFPRSIPLASARVVVEAPTSLDLRVKTLGTGLTDEIEESGSIRRHTITLTPRPYAPEEPGAVSPIDREPTLLVSTFKSYQEMGLAYRDVALPKAAITPEIASLANEITKGIEGKKAQAIAIDAWMKKNIRYVAVYLSLGRVIPNDAAAVLKNKFGDCKDKATLMSALLAVKGIASEEVLINLGNAYTLPEPPTMAVLNHAILYLPELDLYIDPTMTQSAFGILAPEAYDKPVVRVSAAGATLARTPAMQPRDHTYNVRTVIKIAADGTVSGRTEESGTGVFGIYLRSIADQVQNLGSETAAQRQLQSFNTPGTGRYDLGNSAEAVDPVTIKSSFNLHERLKLPPAGSAGIPYGMPLLVRPGNFLLNSRLSGRESAFPCYAGRQTEDFEVTFEPGLPLPNPLISRAINNPAFTYRSSFKLEGRTLKIHREFTSGVSGQACQPELEAGLGDDMTRVRLNMINAFDFGSVASSEPAKQHQTTEVTRVVPADQKRRIDFLYWIDPDCSSPELPTVHIAEQPRNGKLVIEHGTGFTNFPQDNLRYECNKRKSEGVSLVYEPDMRFIGTDSITVDVILPSGRSLKRRYSIDVKAVESVSSVPNSRQTN